MAERKERNLQALPAKYVPDFVEQLDGRTTLGKAIRSRVEQLEVDTQAISHAKRSLVRRAVWLEALCESQEQLLASGQAIDAGAYTQAVNALLGLLRTLGLERKQRPVKRLSEVLEERQP